LFGNRITILAPGKHCDVVWHCQSNCSDHVPEVPHVPHVPKDVPEVPQVPHVPMVSEFVWQQRITLVTFLYKTITLVKFSAQ
jgi:hypothetical protein